MGQKLDIFEEIAKGNLYFDWTSKYNIVVFSVDIESHKKEAVLNIARECYSSDRDLRWVYLTLFNNKYRYFSRLSFLYAESTDYLGLCSHPMKGERIHIDMNRCEKDILSSTIEVGSASANMMRYHENNNLLEKINEMQDKIEQLWFMPGAPGYVCANNNFTSLLS